MKRKFVRAFFALAFFALENAGGLFAAAEDAPPHRDATAEITLSPDASAWWPVSNARLSLLPDGAGRRPVVSDPKAFAGAAHGDLAYELVAGETVAEGRVSLKGDGHGALLWDHSVQFDQKNRKNAVAIRAQLELPARAFAGAVWEADGKAFELPKSGERIRGRADSAKTFALRFPAEKRVYVIAFPEAVPLELRDERVSLGGSFRFCFGSRKPIPVKPGEIRKLSAVLSSPAGPVSVAYARPWAVDGEDWADVAFKLPPKPGSAFDFSVETEKPAGKWGNLKVVDGHFACERKASAKPRFYGLILSREQAFPTDKEAKELVSRVTRRGANAVRLTGVHDVLLAGSRDGVTWDKRAAGKLDALLATFFREGVHVVSDVAPVNPRVPFDPAAFSVWRKHAEAFLSHRNRTTSRRYADEPAFVAVSLNGRASTANSWPELRSLALVQASYAAWLAKKRAADPGFGKGEAPEPEALANSSVHGSQGKWVQAFIADKTEETSRRQRAVLEELGAKVHATDRSQTMWMDGPVRFGARHALPAATANANPVQEGAFADGRGFFRKDPDEPWLMFEASFPEPNPHRALECMMLAVRAAGKNLDGIWRPLSVDPAAAIADAFASRVFLAENVPSDALRENAEKGIASFALERTCGAFAPRGETAGGGPLSFTAKAGDALVLVRSLDKKPVSSSRRLLLAHLPDVQRRGAVFSDFARTTLVKEGTAFCARAIETEIALAHDRASSCKVWSVAQDGTRMNLVASSTENGKLRFKATVRGSRTTQLLYEIVAP